MIKTKNHHILCIQMQRICKAGQCLKNGMQMVLNVKTNKLKFNEDFIKNYDEDSDERYIFEINVEYPTEIFFNKHKDLSLLPEKIKAKLNGPEKLFSNIHNKKNYIVHIRA